MTSTSAIDHFVSSLARFGTHPSRFNQYSQTCSNLDMVGISAPEIRQEQLFQFLLERPDPKLMFVGEAASGLGARFTGIPMTDERGLGGYRRKRNIDPSAIITVPFKRTSAITPKTTAKGALELTAGELWSGLFDLVIDSRKIVITNVVPFHPMGSGQYKNRGPLPEEIVECLPLLEEMISLAPHALLLPVGRVAEQALDFLGLPHLPYLRHPANGGIRKFRDGMRSAKIAARL